MARQGTAQFPEPGMRERDRDDIPGPSSNKGLKAMNITEANVRRLATREGYVLRKSRCRTPEDPSYGGFMLIEPQRNFAVVGVHPQPFSADLEEIHDWLTPMAPVSNGLAP
jgi:hypothetical protein